MKLKKLMLIPLIALGSLTSCKDHKGESTSPGGTSPIQTTTTPKPTTPVGEVCAENTGTPLSNVSATYVNQSFSGKVKVSGIKGKDLYVEDQTGNAFIYAGQNTLPSIKVGDLINVTGTITLYSGAGIYQITDPSVTVEKSSCQLKAPTQVTLSQLDNYRMGRVSLSELEVTNVSKFKTGANDSFITVKDTTGSYDIYMSKRLDSDIKDAIDDIATNIVVGSKIGIVGAFADYYKNPQISLTDASQLVVSMTTDEKLAAVAAKLEKEYSGITVRKNMDLPTSSDFGTKLTWSSSNTKVLSNSGVVTRPTDSDKTITLSCTISLSGKSLTKNFTITVPKYVEGETSYEYTYVEPNYSGNYYTSIDEDDRGTSLLTSLYTMLSKTKMPSNFSYANMWNIFPDTDGVPGKSNTYYAFYTGEEADRSAMNKEHVWPKSRGSGNGGSCEKDPHMIRPALTADNSGRGNDFYNLAPTSYDPGKLGNNDYRGIAARIIFYCAVKYQNEGLKLVDLENDSTSNKSMGKLSTLLKWNLEYDIDKTEVQRNEALYSKYSWVRNPFIDDRNFACKIWGETNAETRKVCGGK